MKTKNRELTRDSNSPKTESNKGGIAALFRKHNRVLTFIGALTIFTTFIVKEGLREELRDFADSIRAAETLFVIRGDIHNAIESFDRKIDKLSYRQLIFSPPVSRQVIPPPPVSKMGGFTTAPSSPTNASEEKTMVTQTGTDETSIEKMIDEESTDLTSAEDQLIAIRRYLDDNIEQLIEKLPSYEADRATLKRLRKGLVAAIDETENFKGRPRSTSTSRHEEFDKLQRSIQVYNVVARELIDSMEISDFENHVLEEARQAREKSERRFRWATWVTYSLYAFGWGLGLLSRFYGLQEESEDA